MMADDIKDIAKSIAESFPEAVRLSEQRDAEEIESILKSMNSAYEVYVSKCNAAGDRRVELMDEVAKTYTSMEEASLTYHEEVVTLSGRLEMFKKLKRGAT